MIGSYQPQRVHPRRRNDGPVGRITQCRTQRGNFGRYFNCEWEDLKYGILANFGQKLLWRRGYASSAQAVQLSDLQQGDPADCDLLPVPYGLT